MKFRPWRWVLGLLLLSALASLSHRQNFRAANALITCQTFLATAAACHSGSHQNSHVLFSTYCAPVTMVLKRQVILASLSKRNEAQKNHVTCLRCPGSQREHAPCWPLWRMKSQLKALFPSSESLWHLAAWKARLSPQQTYARKATVEWVCFWRLLTDTQG